MLVTKVLFILVLIGARFSSAVVPVVLNTWKFTNATTKAWSVLESNKSTIDALVEGCSLCEREQCAFTVGYGGSPDENGETTLDAMIMDGETMNVGAVAGMRRVKDAIAVARHVLENTQHTLLVGNLATSFAEQMGFQIESLVTPKSKKIWRDWKNRNCQPNFWTNVLPDPNLSCGPYRPIPSTLSNIGEHNFGSQNHDTIGMIVIDDKGKVAAGTSTNGAWHRIPGRVGDSPIVGSGAYAEKGIGAAVATGDGDVMMRFLPSFLAVEGLRNGMTPQDAARRSIERIVKHYPRFVGAVLVSTSNGEYSAACSGIPKFPFSVCEKGHEEVVIKYVDCV